MISVRFQSKPFNITVIQVYPLTSNAEEAEVEWFYEDVQDLLELTPKKDVLFNTGDWDAKVGSQEIPGVTGKIGLGVQNEGGQMLKEFCKRMHWSSQIPFSNNTREDYTQISPDGQHQNQIDYILCRQRWRSTISSVQSLSHVWLFVTPWAATHQASLSNTNSRSPPKLMSIESVMPSNHLILCRPLLLQPSILPSIRVFSHESALCIRWPKYWSFSFKSDLPLNTQDWYPLGWTGCISLQSKGLSKVFSNTTVQKHQFFGAQSNFTVQLSHPYMTNGKTIALTRRTFVDKVMSLLFNMLSWLVITFLPRSKHLLISWLQTPSAVIPDQRK